MSDGLSLFAKYLWIREYGMIDGLLIIIAIYIHEFGHYFTALALEYEPKPPKFVPWMGAYVLTEGIKSNRDLFLIVLGGPAAGALFAIPAYYLSLFWSNDHLTFFVIMSLVLNTSNLLPFSFLDGGKIADVLNWKYIKLFVSTFVFIIALLSKIWLVVIIAVLGIIVDQFHKKDYLTVVPILEKSKLMEYTYMYLFVAGILIIHTLLFFKKLF